MSLLSLISISPHHLEDMILYVPFLVGQLIYILKRAGFSMRAGRASTRRAYVYQNWDILAFRSVIEFIVIFTPIRHLSPNQILSFLHLNWSWMTSISFMQTPVSSPVSFLAAGIAADGMVDWLVDYISRTEKVPKSIRDWLTENVPPVNGGSK